MKGGHSSRQTRRVVRAGLGPRLGSSSSQASRCPDGSRTQGWSWEGARQCSDGVQEGADRIPAGQCGGREGQEAEPRRAALQAPRAVLGVCGLGFLLLKRWKERGLNVRPAQFTRSVGSDSFRPHGLQHTRPPCPSPTPGVTQTHVHRVGDAIQPSHPVVPFSSHLQSFPASVSFQMSQLLASGGQSIGVSASTSVLPMNTQG